MPINPCCCGETLYRQARRCDLGDLTDVWMTTAGAATLPGSFLLPGYPWCTYFDFDDPTSATPGTVYSAGDALDFDDCNACQVDLCYTGDCDTSVTNYHSETVWSMDLQPLGAPPPDCTAAAIDLPYVAGCAWVSDDDICIGGYSASGGELLVLDADPENPSCKLWFLEDEWVLSGAGILRARWTKPGSLTPDGTYFLDHSFTNPGLIGKVPEIRVIS